MRFWGMVVDDACAHVGEISLRSDVRQLAGLDQQGDDGPMIRTAVGTGEECVLAREGQRLDGRSTACRSRPDHLRGRRG